MSEYDTTSMADELRWQLRALRQPLPPQRDLWPGIAARLTPAPAPARPRRPWLLAVAATVAVAVGATLLWRATGPTASAPAPALAEAPLQREAEVLTLQYQAALSQMPPEAAAPVPVRHAIDELDRNAALIREALQRDPDSPLLLQQLRRTYTRRLALSQRLAYS